MTDSRNTNTGPIFIGGLSHSGKTPLRVMLSSHSNIALSRRTYMWQRFYGRFGDLSRQENFERCLLAMLAHKSIKALSPDPERIRREYWLNPSGYGRLFALIHQHFAELHGRRRWGAQIGLIEEYADVIFADYPAARMIHMIRDPRTRHQLAPASSAGAAKTGWQTARWLHSATLARRNENRYPGRYLIVGHEELLSGREVVIRRVCDFIDEIFEPAMLTNETAVRFGDGRPVEAGEADKRHSSKTLPRRDLAFTQAYAGRQIADFGYDLAPVRLSLKERLLFNVVDRPANLASMLAWRTLQTIRSSA